MEGFFLLHYFKILRTVMRKPDFAVPSFPHLLMQKPLSPLDGFAFFLLGWWSLPKWTPGTTVCKNCESFLAYPRRLAESEPLWSFVFKIISLRSPTTLTEHLQAARTDTTPQLPHSLCSHFTTLIYNSHFKTPVVLHQFSSVCSSVNYYMRWWARSDFFGFQWWHEQF